MTTRDELRENVETIIVGHCLGSAVFRPGMADAAIRVVLEAVLEPFNRRFEEARRANDGLTGSQIRYDTSHIRALMPEELNEAISNVEKTP